MTRHDDPADLLDSVCDQESFIAFLKALAADFARERKLEAADPSPPDSAGKLGWQNGTLNDVLAAAAAYAEDTHAQWRASGDLNVWKRCARILLAGKYYE